MGFDLFPWCLGFSVYFLVVPSLLGWVMGTGKDPRFGPFNLLDVDCWELADPSFWAAFFVAWRWSAWLVFFPSLHEID